MESVQLTIAPSPGPRFGLRLKLLGGALHLLSLVISCGLLPLFALAFWTLSAGIGRAMGKQDGFGWLVSLFLAMLGSWAVMYLLHDRFALMGMGAQRRSLEQRATAALGPLPEGTVFVEVGPLRWGSRVRPDHALLVFHPDRLVFFGDRQTVTVPRALCWRQLRRELTLGGLLPARLELPLEVPPGGLVLLSLETARALSETATDCTTLLQRLRAWLDSAPP